MSGLIVIGTTATCSKDLCFGITVTRSNMKSMAYVLFHSSFFLPHFPACASLYCSCLCSMYVAFKAVHLKETTSCEILSLLVSIKWSFLFHCWSF